MFGDLAKLLRQAATLKAEAARMKDALEALRIEALGAGGQVRAVVDGYGRLQSLDLAPELVASGDKDRLEAAVIEAVQQAQDAAADAQRSRAEALTSPLGLDLDSLSGAAGD
ncbi:MAG TPA: YbaB/EbfC family nucleoid-associated protein [Armatimonadota bacterium]|nr:YbaB/EbfC family nucleoid-associated protein [Armatimonadota bacterium]